MVHQNTMEKEDMLSRMERERQELNEEILNLQRERDDQLLIAENDKQQVLPSALLGHTLILLAGCFLQQFE